MLSKTEPSLELASDTHSKRWTSVTSQSLTGLHKSKLGNQNHLKPGNRRGSTLVFVSLTQTYTHQEEELLIEKMLP